MRSSPLIAFNRHETEEELLNFTLRIGNDLYGRQRIEVCRNKIIMHVQVQHLRITKKPAPPMKGIAQSKTNCIKSENSHVQERGIKYVRILPKAHR